MLKVWRAQLKRLKIFEELGALNPSLESGLWVAVGCCGMLWDAVACVCVCHHVSVSG